MIDKSLGGSPPIWREIPSIVIVTAIAEIGPIVLNETFWNEADQQGLGSRKR